MSVGTLPAPSRNGHASGAPYDEYAAQSICEDVEAERFAIGCLLQGFDDDRLHDGLFPPGIRRVLFDSLCTIKAEGMLVSPQDDSQRQSQVASTQNTQRVVVFAESLWAGGADDLRRELSQCFSVATLPEMLDHHVERLEHVSRDRRLRDALQAGIESLYDPHADRDELVSSLIGRLSDDDRPTAGFETLSSEQLDAGDFALTYHIDGLLVEGQPCVLAGPKKTLKTNLLIELALTLSTGSWFLQRFHANRRYNVGLMSGESGRATIQETARRVADAKGITLSSVEGLHWCFDLPNFGNAGDDRKLQQFVERNSLDVLIIDPAYLCLPLGDDAGNLFRVGALLRRLTRIGEATGCTIIICHHTRKRGKGQVHTGEPPELDDIAWSGFQEWARQWILLGRREPYDPDNGGSHKLWLSAGGSAGHSALWALDIEEGLRSDPGGRRWEVEVVAASEARQAPDDRAARRAADRDRADVGKVRAAMGRIPAEGETKKHIAELARISNGRCTPALAELVDDGIAEACEITKGGKCYPGFRIRSGTSGTDRDTTGTVPV